MKSFTRFHKLIVGAGAFVGAAVYYLNSPDNQVFNSWTTNYTLSSPLAKWDENWDHRAPQSLVHPKKLANEKGDNFINEKIEANTPKAVRHLLLIRHGQYEINGRTDEDRVLTKLGNEQAAYTGKRLKELGLPYTEVVKSTMKRAQQTGDIILSYLAKVPVKDCNMLREGSPVPPEPPIGHWKPEAFQFYQDGPRIETAFRQYFHRADPSQEQDSYTVLVCHANVIRYFVCRALQFPPEAWLRFSLNHASITWLSITPSGRVILRTLGDSGHIPAHFLSSQ